MTEAACNKLKNADIALNRTYEQVLKAKASDADFIRAFREAQMAWVAFRDAHVQAIYPDPAHRHIEYTVPYPVRAPLLPEARPVRPPGRAGSASHFRSAPASGR
jgi:hypothetical protein